MAKPTDSDHEFSALVAELLALQAKMEEFGIPASRPEEIACHGLERSRAAQVRTEEGRDVRRNRKRCCHRPFIDT